MPRRKIREPIASTPIEEVDSTQSNIEQLSQLLLGFVQNASCSENLNPSTSVTSDVAIQAMPRFDPSDETTNINSWNEWKQLFRSAFPVRVDYDALLKKMLNRRKQPHEDMLKYYYKKMALITTAEITGDKAVNLLINGLNNTSIEYSAKGGNYWDS